MGYRRKARELVLEALYRIEVTQDDPGDIMADIFLRRDYNSEIKEYSSRLFTATTENLKEIDSLIAEYAENWDLSRMAILDKNILRFAICELLYVEGVPVKVILNEAIEIAKRYSTQDSGRFINGVIDRIAKERIR
jgi:transcription antitermination factor NusB